MLVKRKSDFLGKTPWLCTLSNGGNGVVVALLAALIALPSGGLLSAKTSTTQAAEVPKARTYENIPVVSKMIVDDKAVFATVRSSDKAEARARLSGTIVSLMVDEGSQVKRGQLIGTIVDEKLKLKMNSLDASIKASKARFDKASKDFERHQRLKKRGVIASAKLDEVRSIYDVAKNDLKSAQAEKSVIAEQMKEGSVLAPADGRVLKVNVTKSSVIMAGESLASIAANRYILRLELPERHARYINKGDKVMVGARGLDPLEKAVGEGIISQVYPELSNGRVIADVEIGKLGDYFVGERALVRIAADKRRAIIIPGGYSFKRYGMDYVKLAQSEGEPLEVIVQLGGPVLLGKHKGGVEVLAGLRPGDRLVRP